MADLFLGVREDAGPYTMTDEKTGEVRSGNYRNMQVYYGTEDFKTTQNTKSHGGMYATVKKVAEKDFLKVFGFIPKSADDLKQFFDKPCLINFNSDGDIKSINFVVE